MDRERKKRKMENEGREEEEEEEEEKMEKFFALIRSTKDVRDRLRNNLNGPKDEAEGKKVDEEKTLVKVWRPSFQPEDFMHEASFKGSSLENQAGPSSNDEKTKEKGGISLDLKLSL